MNVLWHQLGTSLLVGLLALGGIVAIIAALRGMARMVAGLADVCADAFPQPEAPAELPAALSAEWRNDADAFYRSLGIDPPGIRL